MHSGLINITGLNIIGQDKNGISYDYHLVNHGDFIFIKRKMGSSTGNIYYQGKTKATNPKRFILFNGQVEIQYRHIERDKIHQIHIVEPAIIEIEPNVTHTIKALTDIMLLECHSIQDVQNDQSYAAVQLEEREIK